MTARNKSMGTVGEPTPRELIAMVRHSIRCFWFGAASAAPMLALPIALLIAANGDHGTRVAALGFAVVITLLSLPFSLIAAWNRQRARVVARRHWNPARAQLLWGELLSSLGVLLALLTLVFLIAVWMGLVPMGDSE